MSSKRIASTAYRAVPRAHVSPRSFSSAISRSQQQQPPPQKTSLPGANLPPPEPRQNYSKTTVAIVTKLARLFGYKTETAAAIRTTSDYYDRCAERGELEAPFFYEECMLPPSFQTWFSITTLHVWLLSVRLRALPDPLGKTYIQEMVNHMFIDVEMRIKGPYAVSQQRLIKGYLRDTFEQYRGATTAYDEGLVMGDAVLAAALWRNLFGAGWGAGKMGGVKGKRAPKPGQAPKLGPNPLPEHESTPSPSESHAFTVDPMQAKLLKRGEKAENVFKTDEPIADPKIALRQQGQEASGHEDPDLEFVQSIEKLVRFIRREVDRMQKMDDKTVEGLVAASPSQPGRARSLPFTEFTRI